MKLDQAVTEAREFLTKSGIYGTSLEEISLKGGTTWVVILSAKVVRFPPPLPPSPIFSLERYTVELNVETGDVVGFRKEQVKT